MLQYITISRRDAFRILAEFLRSLTLSVAATICMATFALNLILIAPWAASAQPEDGSKACYTGLVFEPGPIVNGHNRQPTQAEIDERTLALWSSKASAGSCR